MDPQKKKIQGLSSCCFQQGEVDFTCIHSIQDHCWESGRTSGPLFSHTSVCELHGITLHEMVSVRVYPHQIQHFLGFLLSGSIILLEDQDQESHQMGSLRDFFVNTQLPKVRSILPTMAWKCLVDSSSFKSMTKSSFICLKALLISGKWFWFFIWHLSANVLFWWAFHFPLEQQKCHPKSYLLSDRSLHKHSL